MLIASNSHQPIRSIRTGAASPDVLITIRCVAWGVLVIGSGTFTHNLGRPRAPDQDAAPAPDVAAFADWMHAALVEQRVDDLLDYRRRAPFAALQHPTEDHLLPLYVALGAAGERARVTRLHDSTSWGTLRMDAYSFDG